MKRAPLKKNAAVTDFVIDDATKPIKRVSKLYDGGSQVTVNRNSGDVRLPSGRGILLERRGGQHTDRAEVMGVLSEDTTTWCIADPGVSRDLQSDLLNTPLHDKVMVFISSPPVDLLPTKKKK